MVGRMIQLTDEMIINNFDTSSPLFLFELIFLGVMFLILVIVCFISFIKLKKAASEKKGIIIGRTIGIVVAMGIVLLIFGESVFGGILKYNAINYSIENNSWYVEIDTIERTGIIGSGSSRAGSTSKSHYIDLVKYGKVSISDVAAIQLVTGESVYVVIVEGRFGGTYVAQVYPTDKYIYEK